MVPSRDYSDESLRDVEGEIALARVFQKLNKEREEVGLSALSIDSDGEFSLNGYKKLTPKNLDLIRQSIADEKERLERSGREEEVRAEADKEEVERMASSPFAVLAQLKGKLG